MTPQRLNYSTFRNDPEIPEGLSIRASRQKWPWMFWFALKVLGLYHHKSVVIQRKCFCCQVCSINDEISGGRVNGHQLHLDYLNLAYESDSMDIYNHNDLNVSSSLQNGDEPYCAVCETLWWNGSRLPVRYTEEDIGEFVRKKIPEQVHQSNFHYEWFCYYIKSPNIKPGITVKLSLFFAPLAPLRVIKGRQCDKKSISLKLAA